MVSIGLQSEPGAGAYFLVYRLAEQSEYAGEHRHHGSVSSATVAHRPDEVLKTDFVGCRVLLPRTIPSTRRLRIELARLQLGHSSYDHALRMATCRRASALETTGTHLILMDVQTAWKCDRTLTATRSIKVTESGCATDHRHDGQRVCRATERSVKQPAWSRTSSSLATRSCSKRSALSSYGFQVVRTRATCSGTAATEVNRSSSP